MEFAEQKKKIVSVRYNPSAALRAAPPLTQGRLRSAPPVVKTKFHTSGGIWNAPLRRLICAGTAGDRWSAAFGKKLIFVGEGFPLPL